MKLLNFEEPKKAMSTDDWKKISADGAPPGVYRPNMSREDMYKWKAKKIGGKDPRIEIRKSGNGSQMLLVVRNDTVQFSSNGKIILETEELMAAIAEAKENLE